MKSPVYTEKKIAILLSFIHLVILIYTDILYKIGLGRFAAGLLRSYHCPLCEELAAFSTLQYSIYISSYNLIDIISSQNLEIYIIICLEKIFFRYIFFIHYLTVIQLSTVL